MVAGGCCVAAYPRNPSVPKNTLHPAVAIGHGGMESGGVGYMSVGGAIAYRRLPSEIPTGMKTCANECVPSHQIFRSPASAPVLRGNRGERQTAHLPDDTCATA
jgi:hypothetical protein